MNDRGDDGDGQGNVDDKDDDDGDNDDVVSGHMVNNYQSMNITKLDVLSGLDYIKIGAGLLSIIIVVIAITTIELINLVAAI